MTLAETPVLEAKPRLDQARMDRARLYWAHKKLKSKQIRSRVDRKGLRATSGARTSNRVLYGSSPEFVFFFFGLATRFYSLNLVSL